MSFFSGLPLELQTKVLQTIINTGASSLPLFLQAFPELSALVLLISDHVNIKEQLIDIPRCQAVDLEDHDTIARLRGTKPITILSFTKCDEEAAYGRLTRSSDCPYGRYMDCKSAVFVQLCGKALFGHNFIKSLANAKGCFLNKQLVIKHLRPKARSNHVEITGVGEPRKPGKLTFSRSLPKPLKRLISIPNDPEVPWIFTLPFQADSRLFLRWGKITDISLHSIWRINSYLWMPHLERIRVSAILEAQCYDRTRICESGATCDFTGYGLEYAYRVREVYIEFRAARTPIIVSGPGTCCNINEAEQFSFINLDWSEDDPALSSHTCVHAQKRGQVYLTWSECALDVGETPDESEALAFLKIFNKVTFTGIPDRIIVLSTLTDIKKLIWKRLMSLKPAVRALDVQPIIHCPSLETLDLTTLLKTNDETNRMPKIDAPIVRRMDLCSVYGSDMAWNLGFHFTEETLTSVKELSLTSMSSDDSQVISLTLRDLAPLSSSLESLSIVGYKPSFLMSMDDDFAVGFCKLETLHLDMTYLTLETFPGQPRPLAAVLLDSTMFPVLKHLTLDLSSKKRSPLLFDGVCNIMIQVSWSCQLLTVLEPLDANSFFVVREDEERCRGKRLTSGSFYPVVGKPAFMSTDLQVV